LHYYTPALRALKAKLEIAHNLPWGRALDVPKILYDAHVGDGRELTTAQSQSYCLGHLAHWKLLVCSGGERVTDAAAARSPLAAMVADWVRAKFSRGGSGKANRGVNTAAARADAAAADGTVLSLYASRIGDGGCFGDGAAVAGRHNLGFSGNDGGTMLHPTTPTASPALWVCVRDVPVAAPVVPVPLDALDRGTTRSDASAIVFVMDLVGAGQLLNQVDP
jgi:hypothetical protein